MTEKKTYLDEEIGWRIHELVDKKEIVLSDIVSTGAMLQQLMEQRDAIYNDLVYFEIEVSYAISTKDIEKSIRLVDLTRSDKYCDTGKLD